jgi:hypothetical protein
MLTILYWVIHADAFTMHTYEFEMLIEYIILLWNMEYLVYVFKIEN